MSTNAKALLDGAMKGYAFMDGIQRQDKRDAERAEDRSEAKIDRDLKRQSAKKSMEHADKRIGFQSDSFDMRKEEFERKKEVNERVDKGLQAKALFDRSSQKDYEINDKDKEIIKELDIELESLNKPETKQGLNILTSSVSEYLSGKNRGAINTPEFMQSFNQVFKHKVNRDFGVGVTPNDYPGGKILNKEVAGIMPGKKPGTVVIDLRVTGEDKDGKPFEYFAPATINRSADASDNVKQIPVEMVLGDIQARHHLANDPKALNALNGQLRDMMIRAGIEPQGRFGEPERLGAGFVQFDQQGKAHGISGVGYGRGSGSVPKDQQMIEYYVRKHGIKPEQAIQLVNSKNERSVQELASDIYLMKIRTGGEFADEAQKANWLEEARQEAIALKSVGKEKPQAEEKATAPEQGNTKRKKDEDYESYISRALGVKPVTGGN